MFSPFNIYICLNDVLEIHYGSSDLSRSYIPIHNLKMKLIFIIHTLIHNVYFILLNMIL